ncbi:MAG: tRNA dihydrouridine synthase DusB [Pseudomonadota bacterium]|nr:tRNA dihydrouridine synthase DusB [Pseudomonadota bacterium]
MRPDTVGFSQLRIGDIALANPILLAPMSGVTDLPFRRLAQRYGAGLVVSEMVASRELVHERPDATLRAQGQGCSPFVVQLAGREAHWMAEGARIAEGLGADIIDINMGCPAKHVMKGLAGSALMRDPCHALSLVEAVTGAVSIPVTLKMRMGWDHENLNAPELAARAEAAGVRMITVHGRTRCQFFKGKADWPFIATVKTRLSIPVVANGDAASPTATLRMLEESRADGAMIGRGAYGRPWLPGRIARTMQTETDPGDPPLQEQRQVAIEHYEAMLSHYGRELGLRNARKHLGWYIQTAAGEDEGGREWRRRMCANDNPSDVLRLISEFYDVCLERAA